MNSERKKTANERITAFVFLVFAIGFFGSFFSGQWHWFARSGAVMVFCGVLLTGEQLFESRRKALTVLSDFGQLPEKVDATDGHPLYRSLLDKWLGEMFGFYMILAGTLIWGFGDLPSLFMNV